MLEGMTPWAPKRGKDTESARTVEQRRSAREEKPRMEKSAGANKHTYPTPHRYFLVNSQADFRE